MGLVTTESCPGLILLPVTARLGLRYFGGKRHRFWQRCVRWFWLWGGRWFPCWRFRLKESLAREEVLDADRARISSSTRDRIVTNASVDCRTVEHMHTHIHTDRRQPRAGGWWRIGEGQRKVSSSISVGVLSFG